MRTSRTSGAPWAGPGTGTRPAIPLAMSLQMETLAQRLADAGLPALRLRTGDGG